MRSTRNRAIVAVAALSLVVAACGDDEDEAADVSDTEAATATDAPAVTAAAAPTQATTVATEATEATTAATEATTAATEATTAATEATTAATEATTAATEATTAATEATTAATEATAEATTATTTGGTEATTAGTEAGGTMAPVTPGEDWPDSLVFTLTPSQEAGGLIETAEPLAEMLSERLGGIEVEALVPTDYAGVIAALDSGQAQIAGGLGPSQMVQAEEQADATLILQAVRFGSTTYVTQWFTNDPDTFCEDEPAPAAAESSPSSTDQSTTTEDPTAGFLFCNGVAEAESAEDGPIGQEFLPDVAGETVAFVDQGSTSGYLVPALELLNAGVDPTTDITPLFAGGHDAAVQAVYDGDATVGVSFNDARGQLVETVPDVGEKVVVFGWSGPIPNDGFAVAGDLPDDLKQAIVDAFVDITADEEGAALLDELYEIEGLEPVDSASYDVIRELEAELGDLMD